MNKRAFRPILESLDLRISLSNVSGAITTAADTSVGPVQAAGPGSTVPTISCSGMIVPTGTPTSPTSPTSLTPTSPACPILPTTPTSPTAPTSPTNSNGSSGTMTVGQLNQLTYGDLTCPTYMSVQELNKITYGNDPAPWDY